MNTSTFVTFENDETRWVGDPCSPCGGEDILNQNSGFVIGPSPIPTAEPLPSPRKHLRDLVIYELNIDDFTDEFESSSKPGGQHRKPLVRWNNDPIVPVSSSGRTLAFLQICAEWLCQTGLDSKGLTIMTPGLLLLSTLRP